MHSSFMLQVGYYMQIIWPYSAECQKSHKTHETVRDTTTYITLQCGWKVKGERWNGIINSDFNFKTKIGYNQQTSFHNRNYFFLHFMFTYYLQDEPVLMLFSMGYLCHKWPWICSVCRHNILVLSSFMSHHQGCSRRNTTGVNIRSYIAHPSEANSGF